MGFSQKARHQHRSIFSFSSLHFSSVHSYFYFIAETNRQTDRHANIMVKTLSVFLAVEQTFRRSLHNIVWLCRGVCWR